jgi:hypothetical protein
MPEESTASNRDTPFRKEDTKKQTVLRSGGGGACGLRKLQDAFETELEATGSFQRHPVEELTTTTRIKETH